MLLRLCTSLTAGVFPHCLADCCLQPRLHRPMACMARRLHASWITLCCCSLVFCAVLVCVVAILVPLRQVGFISVKFRTYYLVAVCCKMTYGQQNAQTQSVCTLVATAHVLSPMHCLPQLDRDCCILQNVDAAAMCSPPWVWGMLLLLHHGNSPQW